MKIVAEAVKKDIISRGISQAELAQMLNVTTVYINNLLNNKKEFGKKQASRFSSLFGYNESFLLTGKGELINKEDDATIPSSEVNIGKIDQRINELLIISTNLYELYKSVNDRLAEATAIITKSQQQFDRVLNFHDRINNESGYGMVAENPDKRYYNRIADFVEQENNEKQSV